MALCSQNYKGFNEIAEFFFLLRAQALKLDPSQQSIGQLEASERKGRKKLQAHRET